MKAGLAVGRLAACALVSAGVPALVGFQVSSAWADETPFPAVPRVKLTGEFQIEDSPDLVSDPRYRKTSGGLLRVVPFTHYSLGPDRIGCYETTSGRTVTATSPGGEMPRSWNKGNAQLTTIMGSNQSDMMTCFLEPYFAADLARSVLERKHPDQTVQTLGSGARLYQIRIGSGTPSKSPLLPTAATVQSFEVAEERMTSFSLGLELKYPDGRSSVRPMVRVEVDNFDTQYKQCPRRIVTTIYESNRNNEVTVFRTVTTRVTDIEAADAMSYEGIIARETSGMDEVGALKLKPPPAIQAKPKAGPSPLVSDWLMKHGRTVAAGIALSALLVAGFFKLRRS